MSLSRMRWYFSRTAEFLYMTSCYSLPWCLKENWDSGSWEFWSKFVLTFNCHCTFFSGCGNSAMLLCPMAIYDLSCCHKWEAIAILLSAKLPWLFIFSCVRLYVQSSKEIVGHCQSRIFYMPFLMLSQQYKPQNKTLFISFSYFSYSFFVINKCIWFL